MILCQLTALAHISRLSGPNRGLGGVQEGTPRQAIHDGISVRLREKVLGWVVRVLLLELHAARVTGQLSAPDPARRWQEWVAQAQRPGFWESLTGRIQPDARAGPSSGRQRHRPVRRVWSDTTEDRSARVVAGGQ